MTCGECVYSCFVPQVNGCLHPLAKPGGISQDDECKNGFFTAQEWSRKKCESENGFPGLKHIQAMKNLLQKNRGAVT